MYLMVTCKFTCNEGIIIKILVYAPFWMLNFANKELFIFVIELDSGHKIFIYLFHIH